MSAEPTTQSLKSINRPGLVWAVAIFHFGGTALLILFLISIHHGGGHLTALQRARWDESLAHIHIGNILVALLLLTGTALLFWLRKSAFYVYCAVLAGNCLIGIWIIMTKGPAALPTTTVLTVSLGIPLLLCIYSKYLIKKNILI
jgi:predicted membrane channel-forming protein YqfA (hemolysin III family)